MCHRKLILGKGGKCIYTVQYWSFSRPLPYHVPVDKSHAFLSCLLSSSAFPSRKISDCILLLISLQFFLLIHLCRLCFGVHLQMSVSSPIFCVLGVFTCSTVKASELGKGMGGRQGAAKHCSADKRMRH